MTSIATQRWTALRKAEVCAGILRGDDTFNEAVERLCLGRRELASWMVKYMTYGVSGLKLRGANRD